MNRFIVPAVSGLKEYISSPEDTFLIKRPEYLVGCLAASIPFK